MARTAKRPSKKKGMPLDTLAVSGATAISNFVAQNPSMVGGTTAFLIAMSFVSANAIWYQPHAHTSPLFSTRSFETFAAVDTPNDSTTFRLDRTLAPIPSGRPAQTVSAQRDVTVERVQSVLKDLGYYKGDVDGLTGKNTEAAIAAYQQKMGLAVTGRIDKKLLSELGAGDITGSIEPRPDRVAQQDYERAPAPGPSIELIQTGLKAFGNADMTVDGIMGRKTREGIVQFQARYGLEQTGKPDQAVYETMVQEGYLRQQ